MADFDVDAFLALPSPKKRAAPAAAIVPPAPPPDAGLPDPRRFPTFGPAAKPAPIADHEAPGGIAGMIAGHTPISGGQSLARGGLQGLTSGWSDEAAARIDQGVSHIYGVRNIADQFRAPGAPSLTDPNVPYDERRDFYRGLNDQARAANPKMFTGGELLGGLAQQAIPGAGTMSPAVAGGVSGAGYSNADNLADLASDTTKGAVVGGVAGVAGKALGAGVARVAATAPGRAVGRQLSRLGEGVKKSLRAQLATPQVERKVANIIATDPAIKGALKSPADLVAAADNGITAASAEGKPIYAAADAASAEARAADVTGKNVDQAGALTAQLTEDAEHAAIMAGNKAATKAQREANSLVKQGLAKPEDVADYAKQAYQQAYDKAAKKTAGKTEALATAEPIADQKGGLDRNELEGVFDRAAKNAVNSSQHPHQATTIERLRSQFFGGVGNGDGPVPSYDVRQFLSKQLQKPAFGGDPNVDPTAAKEATQTLAIGMKKVLDEYILEHASPGDAARLLGAGGINDRISAYHVIGNVAEEQRVSGKIPGIAGQIAALVGAARSGGPAATGAVIGSLAGHPAAGAAVGYVAGKIPGAVDRALATRPGQALGRAAPALAGVGSRALSQPTIDALVAGGPARRAATHQEVFGR